MAAPEPLQKLFAAIDKNKLKFIENLRKAVAIKSVSAWPHTRPDITTMMKVKYFFEEETEDFRVSQMNTR